MAAAVSQSARVGLLALCLLGALAHSAAAAAAVERIYEEGVTHLGASHFRRALELFDEVLALDPDHQPAWHNRGVCMESLRLYEDALHSFEKALSFGSYRQGLFAKGTNLVNLKRHSEAAKIFEKLAEEHPDFADSQFNMGLIAQVDGNMKKAEKYYKKTLELDPDHQRAKYNMCTVVFDNNDHQGALQCWKSYVERYPDDLNAYNGRGSAYAKLDQMDLAMKDFEHVTIADPTNALGWNNRGYIFSEAGKYEDALVCAENCLAYEPDSLRCKVLKDTVNREMQQYLDMQEKFGKQQAQMMPGTGSPEDFEGMMDL